MLKNRKKMKKITKMFNGLLNRTVNEGIVKEWIKKQPYLKNEKFITIHDDGKIDINPIYGGVIIEKSLPPYGFSLICADLIKFVYIDKILTHNEVLNLLAVISKNGLKPKIIFESCKFAKDDKSKFEKMLKFYNFLVFFNETYK